MPEEEIKLSERKQKILLVAVEDYIQKASPITSSAIQHKYAKELSTATLRNELNALEAMGYLKQLHTSSGRVPTSKGYRFYVNSMIGDIPLDKKVLNEIHSMFEKRTVYLGEMVGEIASVISKATNYPTVVMLKGFDKLIIKNIKIIPLLTGQALILIETNSGIISNSMESDEEIPQQSYIDASNLLTKTFCDSTVSDMIKNMPKYIEKMDSEVKEFSTIFSTVIKSLKTLTDNLTQKGGITARGEIKLLNTPEYSDPEKAKQIINVLSNPNEIKEVFSEDSAEVSFQIGSEIPVEELKDCSIAKADYQVDGESIASIGIIGPQRMDYAKIASALKFVVGEFQNLKALTHKEEKEDDKKWAKTNISIIIITMGKNQKKLKKR